jgi:hypothetical protein
MLPRQPEYSMMPKDFPLIQNPGLGKVCVLRYIKNQEWKFPVFMLTDHLKSVFNKGKQFLSQGI